nr:hypothetical protein BCCFPMHH_00030 [uncultured bacterium]
MKVVFKGLTAILLTITCHTALAQQSSGAAEPLGIKVGVGFDQGFGVTAQFEDNMNVFLGNDGISADYIVKKGKFDPSLPINWYVGLGAALNWGNDYNHSHSDGTSHNESYNVYSARVPLGITYAFAKGWDVYGQAAPDLSFVNKPHDSHFKFGVDLGVGIRYAF